MQKVSVEACGKKSVVSFCSQLARDWLLCCSDYGYHRPVGSEECILQSKFKEGKTFDICSLGHEEEIITEGFVCSYSLTLVKVYDVTRQKASHSPVF